MGKYVENNLIKNETIIKKATLNPLALVASGIKLITTFGILYGLYSWISRAALLLGMTTSDFIGQMFRDAFSENIGFIIMLAISAVIFIPVTIKEIGTFFRFFNMELAITDKRLLGRTGVIKTESIDVPLDKINSVTVSSGLFGKIFRYGTILVSTANFGTLRYEFISDVEGYKRELMQEIDRFNEKKSTPASTAEDD